jgi:transcription elongation factor Elf1
MDDQYEEIDSAVLVGGLAIADRGTRTISLPVELIERSVGCPYCGDEFLALIDLSSGSSSYIEDCEVCCRPIEFQLACTESGEISNITLWRDDD